MKIYVEVVPTDDIRKHIKSLKCKCSPNYDYENEILIHNSYDKREISELKDLRRKKQTKSVLSKINWYESMLYVERNKCVICSDKCIQYCPKFNICSTRYSFLNSL